MSAEVHFYDLHPRQADMRSEVLEGLSRTQKWIPPKFFYDQRGSKLFDAITKLPEYYPTRAEIGILERHGEEMAAFVGREVLLVELGSGSSLKIRRLLDALRPAIYVAVDISKEHLLLSAQDLARSFPGLDVHAACADYSVPFELPVDDERTDRAAFFPGSSIGNFHPAEARVFLMRVGKLVGPGGRLLVGVDLIKDPRILHAAYNDALGVTADFNLNLLRRINRELAGTFDLHSFRHQAHFNAHLKRVEMHLISRSEQSVSVAGEDFEFRAGESIHTENSYKYSIDGFQALARSAGFAAETVWTDPECLFSVHCLRFAGDADS
jgi:dimethylhistidine N-methyltransferase